MTFEMTNNVPARLYKVAASLLLAALVSAAVAAPWMGVGLYMTSGVWAALAVDLAEGMLYRPILSDDGYGGTRYFPLHFVLHAGLIKTLGNPIAAAYVISYSAGIALLAGVYRCLTQFNVSRGTAVLCALLSFSALTVHACLYQIRPDILATAFNVWGISCCISPKTTSKRWIVVATVFFTLAFLTKFTTVFGLTTVVAYWALKGRRGDAAVLALSTAVISVLALIGVNIASEGRAVESFLACATGGTTLKSILMGQYRFLYTARFDIPYFITLAAAFSVLYLRGRNKILDLPIIFFVLTLGATLIIASDTGAGINHFIDLQIAGTMLCAVQIAERPTNRFVRYALPASGLTGAIFVGAAVVFLNVYFTETRYEHHDHIMKLAGTGEKPLLADDPWIPILANEHPFILDNYSMRVMSENNPEIADDLFKKLDDQFFRAAVLFYGNQAPRGRDRNLNIETDARNLYYSWMLYPEGFYDRLTQSYAPIEFVGEYLVLLPR